MKTVQLKASEIKVTYKSRNTEKPKITSSLDVYSQALQIYDSTELELREKFYVLFLNRANHVLGFHCHSVGGIAGTVVDIRLIMSLALKVVASAIILIHNHPSGNLKPSEQDREITQRLKDAGKLLDITVFDHVIITGKLGDYYSFADEGDL
jgi:DNA repair protein RadC